MIKKMSVWAALMSLFFAVPVHADAPSGMQSSKPNIVLFFVDELGWNCIGHRNSLFETSNVDQLTKDGM